jgi:hypothetical protein
MKTLCSAVFLGLLVSFTALAQPTGGGEKGSPRGGPGGAHRPPPEALEACKGKSADASCSFTHHGYSVEGTCFTPASDKPLACRPAKGPRGGKGAGGAPPEDAD